MAKLKVGDQAPDFELESTKGGKVGLSSYRGKWVVLYFYPKAFTPGCTLETVRFAKSYEDFRALNAEIIGVSVDPLATQCDFGDKYDVAFPLLADPEKGVSEAYNTLRPLLPVNRRLTYLIDPQGVVREIYHHELMVEKHIEKALAYLRAQKTA